MASYHHDKMQNTVLDKSQQTIKTRECNNEDQTLEKKNSNAKALNANLSRELFVFANAKAGMSNTNQDKIHQIVYDASKNSKFFKESLKRNAKVDTKVAEIKHQISCLSSSRKQLLSQQIDKLIVELESSRDLTRTKVVIDMDMFFAAVEMRDNPALAKVPLAVGGMSMISTTNYIARKYGVRAAMPGFIGKKLCPDLVFVPGHYEKYTEVANQTREIFAMYDPQFSAMSLDEACLDITDYIKQHWRSYAEGIEIVNDDIDAQESDILLCYRSQIAGAIVNEIRTKIYEKTQLTASAGVAVNRMLAKICSDMNKPNGQYVLQFTREAILNFLQDLPVRKIGGIGKVMEKTLSSGLEITTGKDLFDKRVLCFHVFTHLTATWLLRISLGIQQSSEMDGPDESIEYQRKSFSRDRTFSSKGISSPDELTQKCRYLCDKLAVDIERNGKFLGGKTFTLKLKSVDFSVRQRSISVACTLSTSDEIFNVVMPMLTKELPVNIRLMGIRVSSLVHKDGKSIPERLEIDSEIKLNGRKRQLDIAEFTAKKTEEHCEMQDEFQLNMRDNMVQQESKLMDSIDGSMAESNTSPERIIMSNKHQSEKSQVDPFATNFHPCPICGTMINTGNLIVINAHIDNCIEYDGQNTTLPPIRKKQKQNTLKSFFNN